MDGDGLKRHEKDVDGFITYIVGKTGKMVIPRFAISDVRIPYEK